jgi:hypothetical protein
MAPFRVRRRGATRCKHTVRSPPPWCGSEERAVKRALIALVTIGRATRGVRLEPRARPVIPIGRIEIDA